MSFRSLCLRSAHKVCIVVLAVYVDDILLIGSDSAGIMETKMYFKRHFVIKDMGRPKYFLRIKIIHQKHNVLLSQRKYALDLLEEKDFWDASLLIHQ